MARPRIAGRGACVAGVALLVRGFVAARNDAAAETEREQPIAAPLRVATKNGAPVITIDDETQERSGIATQVVASTSYQQKIRAYAMVLDVARLTALSNNYAGAEAQVRTAQAKIAMSKPAFERAQNLYEDQQALSQAQMQSAQAAFLTDQASLAAAQAQVRSLAATAFQEWGSALGRSLVEESPMTTRLIERQDFLLQITLPPGVSLPVPPATAAMEMAAMRARRSPSSRRRRTSIPGFKASAFFTWRQRQAAFCPVRMFWRSSPPAKPSRA